MKILQLDKDTARKYESEIIYLHNLIPYQLWKSSDLFKEKDENREYIHKWQISQIAFENSKPIGICISFYCNKDNFNKYLYVHRLSVDQNYRLQGIGRKLCIECCKSFREYVSKTECDEIRVQSPKDDYLIQHETVSGFYKKIGFKPNGFKNYSNRIDIIYTANIDELLNKY